VRTPAADVVGDKGTKERKRTAPFSFSALTFVAPAKRAEEEDARDLFLRWHRLHRADDDDDDDDDDDAKVEPLSSILENATTFLPDAPPRTLKAEMATSAQQVEVRIFL
jgi:hypothetical protein